MTKINTMFCPMQDVVPKRELRIDKLVNPDSHTPYAWFDYLTLYSPDGIVLARSTGYLRDMDIVLNFRGLIFICSPGYEDAIVAIEWKSLVDWVNGEKSVVDTKEEVEDDDEQYFYGG